jgi:hypothetical protein
MAAVQDKQNKRIKEVLRKVFGMEALRDGQRNVIDSVLAGRDTLAVMPTGSGKSLCYQLPARLLDGVTLVVSPLISLMKDQAEKLEEAGIASAAQINSSLSRSDELAALEGIERAGTDIIFCTPERLATPDFLALLKGSNIALVVIDEAHCISQWGHDFRPAYLEIGAALDALGRPLLLALTATATDDVVNDIRSQLGRPRMEVVNTGIYRPNLHYRVRQVTNPDEKYADGAATGARHLGRGHRLRGHRQGGRRDASAAEGCRRKRHAVSRQAARGGTRREPEPVHERRAPRDGGDQRVWHGHRQERYALRHPPAGAGQPGSLLPGVRPRRAATAGMPSARCCTTTRTSACSSFS